MHRLGKAALGPWTKFASAEVLDRALVYIGATEEQITEHRDSMQRWGQGSRSLPIPASTKEPAQDRLAKALMRRPGHHRSPCFVDSENGPAQCAVNVPRNLKNASKYAAYDTLRRGADSVEQR
jgi:hypothetical protein